MVIRIKKSKDGRTALSCVRPDGTTTWQRQESGHAAFFPRHDLTHYAVETVLGLREGFYGLVAAGWDFSDFGTPWPRGRIPLEANVSEIIVSFFDLERRVGEKALADDLNAKLSEFGREEGLLDRRRFTDNDLARIRQVREELFAKWDAVKPGDALEISFPLS